jgi:TolA-binding protein
MQKIKLTRKDVISGKIELPKPLKFAKSFNFQSIHCEDPPTPQTTTFEVAADEIRKLLHEANLGRQSIITIDRLKRQLEAQKVKVAELKGHLELHRKSERNLLGQVRQLEKNINQIEQNAQNPIDDRLAPKSPISHTALLAEKGVDLRSRALSAGLPSLGKKR